MGKTEIERDRIRNVLEMAKENAVRGLQENSNDSLETPGQTTNIGNSMEAESRIE